MILQIEIRWSSLEVDGGSTHDSVVIVKCRCQLMTEWSRKYLETWWGIISGASVREIPEEVGLWVDEWGHPLSRWQAPSNPPEARENKWMNWSLTLRTGAQPCPGHGKSGLPAFRLQDSHQQPRGSQTFGLQLKVTGSRCSEACRLGLSHAPGISGSPACRWPAVELLSHHIYMSHPPNKSPPVCLYTQSVASVALENPGCNTVMFCNSAILCNQYIINRL